MTAPVDAATYKPGDEVNVRAWVDQDEHGHLTLTFPRNPHHADGPGVAAEVRLAHLIAQHVERVADRFGELFPHLAALRDAPAPYSEPRDGDEVEVTFRGTVKPTGGALCFFADGLFLNSDNLAHAVAEGRVRLVRAAAPSYEPGKWYRQPDAQRPRWMYTGHESVPWMFDGRSDGVLVPMNRADYVPSDLVRCDVVPRGEGA